MKDSSLKRNILLTPGPATTTDAVKYAQVVPDICPREKKFADVMNQIRKDLVKIVEGDVNYTSILFSGSGTAALDACINSVVPPKGKIAIINNGAYGERMVKIAQAYRIPYTEIYFRWGDVINMKTVIKNLKEDRTINCLSIVHHETSTGMLNPVKDVGEIAKRFKCVFMVDAISSFAGTPISIKDYKIDFMVSVSSKCIQGIAGLAFVICRKGELEKTKSYQKRSFYLNLYKQYEYFEKEGQMRFTAPVQTTYALRQAIKEYFKEGAKKRYKRYTNNWKTLRKGLKEIGFQFLLDERHESHILTTVLEPSDPNYNFATMHDLLFKKGFIIYPGKISEKHTFRLANIGALGQKDIENFLIALKKTLDEMGVRL